MRAGRRSKPPCRIPPPPWRGLAVALIVLAGALSAGQPCAHAADPHPLAPPEQLERTAWVFDVPPTLDGRLTEWDRLPASAQAVLRRADQLHPGRKDAWEGPADAAAQVGIAVHGENLYLGIHVDDDAVFHDPERSWWHGDSLELFIDADRPADGPPPHEFTENCWQVFLMPANPELPWGVVFRGKRLRFDDGGLHGVEVVRGPPSEGVAGYDAEVRIPLRNFGLDPAFGGRVGFALALNDADEAPEQPGSYLSWNQGFDLYRHPDHFGVLEIPPQRPSPAPPSEKHSGFWWMLLALLAATAAAVVLAGPGARWLARIGPRPKWILLAVTALAALGIYLGARWTVDAERTAVEQALDDAAQAAARVARDAQAWGGLQEPDPAAQARSLVELLRGGRIPCNPGVADAALVALHPARAFQAGTTPPYAIDLRRPHTFHLRRAESFDHVQLELASEAQGRSREASRVFGRLTLHAPGGGQESVRIDSDGRRDRTADAPRKLSGTGPWRRIEWQPADSRMPPMTLRALNVSSDGFEEDRRGLLLSGRTRQDIPVLSHGQGPDLGRDVVPGASIDVALPTVAGADRLWVLLTPRKAFPALLGEHRLGTLQLLYDDGHEATPVELHNGEDLTAARLPAGLPRPPHVRSLAAFQWRDNMGHTHVRQAIPLPLDSQRPPRKLRISADAKSEGLRVVAATVVRSLQAPDASAVRVVIDELGRDSLLLAEPADTVARYLEPGETEPASLVVRSYPSADVAIPVPLTLTGRLPEGVAARPDRARIGLLVCLGLALFLAVLLVVDAAARLRYLTWRLGIGMLAAALVPLGVTILLVDRENTRRVQAEYAARGRAGVEAIDGQLREALAGVQAAADGLARHLGAEEDRPSVGELSRLVVLHGATMKAEGLAGSIAIAGAAVPAVHVPLRAGRTAHGLHAARFLQEAGEQPGLRFSPWDGLLLVGTARSGRADDWVRVTIGVRIDDGYLAALLGASLDDEAASATLVDDRGRRLADAGPHAQALRHGIAARMSELARRGGGAPLVLERVGDAPAAQLVVAERVGSPTPGSAGGTWLALGLDRGAMQRAIAGEREMLVWLGLFGLVLIVGVAALVARRVADPVRDLVRVTEAVRQGRFDVRAPDAGADEVGRLSVAFDQMRRDLKHRVQDLDFLRGAQDALAASLDFGTRSRVVLELFRDRFEPDDALLLDARGPGGPVSVVAETADERRFADRPISPAEGGWLARALGADAPLDVHATPSDEAFPAEGAMGRRLLADAAAWIAVPLKTGRLVQGLLLMGWKDADRRPRGEARRMLEPLAGVTASALNNARLYRLAALDDVTHLPGATAFEAALRSDVERALAGGQPAILMRIGLDHLEHATMRRGVELSRELLRTAASALLSVVGDRMQLGRLREEELAVRMPGAGPEAVRELAETIRARLGLVEVQPEEGGDPVGTTVSVGVARCPADARSLEFLLDAAARALAAAQREGGDRVEDAARLGAGAVAMPPFEEGAVFRNEAMVQVVEAARRAARSDASVFVTGETGTGKEVIASLVHRRSARSQRPFVTVNCAAFPETLLESELFGHERGAFTGAERRREGRFELADGGTLFLDEVAEMTPSAQVKLLRVLQERQFTRLGGTRTVTVDVRIIAATNRDLEEAVADGTFREDLYYRLNVIRLEIPPLRRRREEIPPLVELFLREAAHRTGGAPKRLTSAAMDVLYRHPWPGNVRELKNVIERCVVLTESEQVGPDHLQLDGTRGEGAPYLPPQSAPQDDLNARQRKLLDHLALHGRCTNREYYEMAGTSPRTGLRDVQDLMKRGLLVREGKRRGAVYRLP